MVVVEDQHFKRTSPPARVRTMRTNGLSGALMQDPPSEAEKCFLTRQMSADGLARHFWKILNGGFGSLQVPQVSEIRTCRQLHSIPAVTDEL